MKETKYQELKTRIDALEERLGLDETRIIDTQIWWTALDFKVEELIERLDTWDHRLAKWAKKGGLE